jgi:hypothetical protein
VFTLLLDYDEFLKQSEPPITQNEMLDHCLSPLNQKHPCRSVFPHISPMDLEAPEDFGY